VKDVDELSDRRRDDGFNRNGKDPKLVEIMTDRFVMEKVLVVIEIIDGDIPATAMLLNTAGVLALQDVSTNTDLRV